MKVPVWYRKLKLTFPQTELVPVVTKPLTGPEQATPAGNQFWGSLILQMSQPLLVVLNTILPDNDTNFAVSPDEPLFGENVQQRY